MCRSTGQMALLWHQDGNYLPMKVSCPQRCPQRGHIDSATPDSGRGLDLDAARPWQARGY